MNEVFISPEMYRAMRDAATRRDKQQVVKYSNHLYHLISDGVQAIQKGGADYVVRVIDRNVGKTYALVRAAVEFGLPIAVPNRSIGKLCEEEAVELFGKAIRTINLNGYCDGIRAPIVLKEEGATVEKIEEKIGKHTFVVGFASMYE